MFTKFYYVFILTVLFQLKVSGQNLHTISGIVKDEKGETLPYASVLIAGSTRGTQTDVSGKFTLNNITAGNYQLIISFIGFDRITRSITIKNQDIYQEYVLKPSPVSLKDVVVSYDPDRDKHLALFKKFFIGETDNAKQCVLLNPDVLNTHFNKSNQLLSVSADSLLVINNQALGYRIKYLLTAFELDYKNAIFKFSGIPLFEELKGSDKQKAEWERRRQKAYNGSVMHFFRSAYNNSVGNNGFILYSTTKQGNAKNREPNKLNPSQIFFKTDGQFVSAKIDSSLYVVYTRENTSKGFATTEGRVKIPLDAVYKNAQVSKVTMLCDNLIIDKNGNYIPDKNHALLKSINFQGYWAWEKVADLLPFDYQDKNVITEPDGLTNFSKSSLNTYVQEQNESQLKTPFEKLYADMDKFNYTVGDTIWLKLYLVNASNLTADTKSKIGYIDIINNATAEVVKQTMLHFNNGTSTCTLYGKELVEGSYTLRAYTNWMRNYDPSIFFTKSFDITGTEKPPFFLNSRVSKINDSLRFQMQFKDENGLGLAFNNFQINTTNGKRVLNKQTFTTTADGNITGTFPLAGQPDNKPLFLTVSDRENKLPVQPITIPVQNLDSYSIDLQFMPEGGKLIAGMVNKVGFKAISKDGKGIAVQGKVMDSRNRVVTGLKSNYRGMGFFELTVNAGESYSVVLADPYHQKIYRLPKAAVSGTSLRVINTFHKDSLNILVRATNDLVKSQKKIYLVGKCRGLIYYAASATIKENTTQFNIAKSVFPGGITHILLLNAAKKITNERLVYIDGSTLIINLKQNKLVYGTKDSVGLNLDVTDNDGEPVNGSFSVAVTDDSQVNKDKDQNNICSYLLLSSDLKGHIETPGYFLKDKEENRQALDELLLTQGWTDYKWNENIDTGKTHELLLMSGLMGLGMHPPTEANKMHEAEQEIVIKGTVAGATPQNYKDIKVSLFANKPLIIKDTTVSTNGEFVFKNLPQLDTAAAFIFQATNKNKPIAVKVDQPQLPQLVNFKPQPNIPWYINTDTTGLENYKSVTAKANNDLKAGYRVLKEVVIRDKQAVKGSKNLNGPGGADQVIDAAEIEKAGEMNLLQFFGRSVKGFHQGLFPLFTGVSDYLLGRKQLRLVVDGLDLDFFAPPGSQRILFYRDYMQSIAIKDIKGIEVMQNNKYANAYDSQLLPTDLLLSKSMVSDIQYAYIEVTTYNGQGPFWRSNNLQPFRPLTFNKPSAFYKPRYTAENRLAATDFRSTVYWAPDVITDETGKAKLDFFTTNRKGEYTLTINGTDLNGNIGFFSTKISVK